MSDGDASNLLEGLRVVEISAFVAVPLAGLTLAQLGADVIRIDPLHGALDYERWPVTSSGDSLYWTGLNKSKRSVQVDVRSDLGRDLVKRLITSPGSDAGVLITNLAPRWLDFDELTALRPDLIAVRLMGSPDGTAAVDYTVNAGVGYPAVTGRPGSEVVNHVLPAWDLIAGNMVATAVLAAERKRSRTGKGAIVEIALSDVAMAAVGHLGHVAEVAVNDEDRPSFGNYLYGAFGRDFETSDGRRVMVVALTRRQWDSLTSATELGAVATDDLQDEGARFRARAEIAAALEPWFAARTLDDVGRVLNEHRVCWGPYQTFRELVEADPRMSGEDSIYRIVNQPGIGSYPMPASPLRVDGRIASPTAAPEPGADTQTVLMELLGYAQTTVDELRDQGVL